MADEDDTFSEGGESSTKKSTFKKHEKYWVIGGVVLTAIALYYVVKNRSSSSSSSTQSVGSAPSSSTPVYQLETIGSGGSSVTIEDELQSIETYLAGLSAEHASGSTSGTGSAAPVTSSGPTQTIVSQTHQTVSQPASHPTHAQSYSTYTVKPGDTLWGISEKFTGNGENWHDLAQINNISNPRDLQIGTVLRLPQSWGHG